MGSADAGSLLPAGAQGQGMSEIVYPAYDKDGHRIGDFPTPDDAEEAIRRHEAKRELEEEEVAVENKILSAKPTLDDKIRVAQLPPGVHLTVNQPARRTNRGFAVRGTMSFLYVVIWVVRLVIAVPVTMAAWFSIVFTGNYPPVLFEYNARTVRYLVRTVGYMTLVADIRPPMTGAPNPLYPIQLDVIRAPIYSRMRALIRLPMLIPLALADIATLLLALVTSIPSYAMLTLFRYQPAGLQAVMKLYVRVHAEFLSSALLLTESWWISDSPS